MSENNSFIPTQCIFNNNVINAFADVSKDIHKLNKSIKRTKSLTGLAVIGIAAATYFIFTEIRYNKEETDRKIKRLEEEIQELKEE